MDRRSALEESLTSFLQGHGAHLHPNVAITQGKSSSGFHWRATRGAIEPGDTIISVPHSVALSYLNALVDEDWPFKKHRQSFNPDFEVETISFFYLMIQYNNPQSFWRPYLDALPAPEQYHTQPLFFEHEDDVKWLEGTDVWHTNQNRLERYRAMYDDGLSVLQSAGCNVSWCTWHMFKWAASVFTSRSFSSRAIRPHDSKYWAAYRHGKDGRSQTVLIDMSHASTSDFPVLFPGLDIGNHSNDAKIDYIFDPGRFEIKTNTATVAGEEVFNNYGPKGNDELLLGYGFCIPQNPYNTVPLLLKAPPKELQRQIRDVHSGYFRTAQGDDEPQWNNERTTFQLSKPGDTTQPAHIFQHLPEALIELLIYVLHHEQIHSFTFVERPREYIVSEGGKRYLPHLANIMTQSLMAKLYKLQPDDLPEKPQNAKQQQAEIYRVDQRKLIESLLVCFRQYLRSLLAQDAVDLTRGPCLVRLETVVEFCEQRDIMPAGFMDGIEVNTNTRNIEQLVLAGWEQDIWILLSVALSITSGGSDGSPFRTLPPYMHLDAQHMSKRTTEINQDPEHPSHGLMELVCQAADACPDSIWGSQAWNTARMCEHAKRLEFDGFVLYLTNDDAKDEARFCIYLDQAASASPS